MITASCGLSGICLRLDIWKNGNGTRRSAEHRKAGWGVQSNSFQYLPGQIGPICRESTSSEIQPRGTETTKSTLQKAGEVHCPCQEKGGSESRSCTAKAAQEICLKRPSRPGISTITLYTLCR